MSTERQTIYETISPPSDFYYGSTDVGEFVAMINTMLLEIPFKHRREAKIEFDVVGVYGCDEVGMTITYQREESDEEYQGRQLTEDRAFRSQEDHELEEYNRLKEKFEK